ncbi:cytochrome P450 [Halovulum dunhuangense]|uniref:Cytochrome P450 n=1 Tax=Halovulum dunhuangense TaxID=1505036 RepID=A0A849L2N0_9RHOB|nr:cytochrome P450 [Halovulum dunhuangense]NNU80482.1 cytochrome P450 [Halovulum dunhuangense]
MPRILQSPREDGFVQDPYPFYERLRALGPLAVWEEYGFPVTGDHALVSSLLRDRRFGREVPPARRKPVPPHLEPFQRLEDRSLLSLEPPAHTRLRKLVLSAFTSRAVAAQRDGIATLAHELIDRIEGETFDLLTGFAEPLPVRVIARLIGVPEEMAPQLLDWSHAMVAMYQARRDGAVERAAGTAAAEFSDCLAEVIAARRLAPRDDLISDLIAARDAGDRLTEDEMIATLVLLLNAGHEATVHSIANGVKALLEAGLDARSCDPARLCEEVLRFDPPLHLFTRFCTEEAEIAGHRFAPGDEVGLLLAAANRDAAAFPEPSRFDPTRPAGPHTSLGAGIHFCVGAPLARAEIEIALPILFQRLPRLSLEGGPRYADRYHFHGLTALRVRRAP